jgi:protein SCO1/2
MNKRINILLGISFVTVVLLIFIVLNLIKKDGNEPFVFNHPAIENPDVTGKQVVERVELLDIKKAFDFKLTNQNNEETQLSDFNGKLALVGFIYTSCPDVCGLLTQHFRFIQRKFNDIIDKDLVLVFITTDPEKDTPERIKAYTDGFGGKWQFLTGSEPQLKEVWENYKVFVKEKRSIDVVYHSYMVALIDGVGNIRYRYVGLVNPEDVIVKDIRNLLKEKESMI